MIKKLFYKFIIPLIVFSLLFSCSGYIGNINKELDKSYQGTGKKREDKFELFKKQEEKKLTSKDVNNLRPPIKRAYSQSKRTKATDLRDDNTTGSLWTDRGDENFFFAKNRNRKSGDIVILEVQSKLKKEISLELSRTFPVKRFGKKGEQGQKAAATSPANAAPNTAATTAAADAIDKNTEIDENPKVYDHISSIVGEEINQDHVILKGRKDVLYKNRKRLVEIQALVAKKDISDMDTIMSSSIIESSIRVIK